MKRPLAIVGFTVMATLLIVNFIAYEYIIYLALFVSLLFFISFFIKNRRKRKALNLFFISVISAFVVFLIYNTSYVQPITNLEEHSASINGRLIESPYQVNQNYFYKISTNSIELHNKENSPQNINLILHTYSPLEITYSDSIYLDVEFIKLDETYKNYNYAENIFIGANFLDDNITIDKNTNDDLISLVLNVKDAIINRVYDIMPYTQATLANAVIIGDKQSLESDIKTDFYDTGVSHLVVVSGLHLSIVANFIFLLIMFIKKNIKLASISAIIAIIIFMIITGFSASVVRAGLMLIIMFSANLLSYKSDSLTSIGFAGLVLCAVNPYSMLDVGLLLSFGATLAIVLFYMPTRYYLYRKLFKKKPVPKILDYFISVSIISCCVVFITLPITFIYFGTFSPYFIISNLLLVYPATILLISTILMLLFSIVPVFSIISTAFAFVSTFICDYMINTANFIDNLPYSNIDINLGFIKIWLIISIILILSFLIFTKKKSSLKLTVPLSLCILVVISISTTVINQNKITLNFICSGDGISAIIYKDDDCAVLSSGGSYGNDNTINELNKYSNIDLQIIGDKKVNKAYSQEILYTQNVNSVVILDTYANELEIKLAENKQENIIYFNDSQNIELWDDVKIELLNIDDKLWQYIECSDNKILIAPNNGDFSNIDAQYLDIDYLVINQAPQNIDLVECSTVIISSSRNGIEEIEKEISDFIEDKNVYTTEYENQVISLDEVD